MVDLRLGQSLLVLHNLHNETIILCHQVTECHKCDLDCMSETAPQTNATLVLNSKYEHRIAIRAADAQLCVSERTFLDREESLLTVSGNICSYSTTAEGSSEAVAVWTMIGIYMMISALTYVAVYMWKSYTGSANGTNIAIGTDGDKEESDEIASASLSVERAEEEHRNAGKRRIRSLDAFRGLTVLLMIFVNYGGGGCSCFEHVAWYGLTVADIVFPAFVLVMGFSIALSTRSRLTARKDFVLLLCKVFRRSGKLFLLGIVLNTDFSNLSELRIPGVLQRFALSYLFVAVFHVLSVYRANKYLSQPEDISRTQLLLIFAPEITAHLTMLMTYLYFTFWFQYSDSCPKGYQGPGGLEDHAHFFNCTGGAANYLDLVVFGKAHIYQRATSVDVYRNSMAHDPEGLLGTTTSILMAEFGLICGRILIKVRSHNRRLISWFVMAVMSGVTAFALTHMNTIPVVKNLWSLSYVCVTSAVSLAVFIVMYILIDATCVWREGWPLHFPGSNPILLYVGHLVLHRYFPFYFEVGEGHAQRLAQLSFSSFLWLLISMYLFRRKIFCTL